MITIIGGGPAGILERYVALENRIRMLMVICYGQRGTSIMPYM